MRDMLRHAYYWRWASGPDLPVSRYVDAWGRRGDTAVIAIDEFQPVGAAWFRLFRSSQPGYGFVDEQTPELTIAVVPSRRGRGYGAELLQALLAEARKQGFLRISLSVESDSPAVKLYEAQGFHKVDDAAGTVTMLAELGEPG